MTTMRRFYFLLAMLLPMSAFAQSGAPNLVYVFTMPDSLHYNAISGNNEPAVFDVVVRIVNTGDSAVKDLSLTLVLPVDFTLFDTTASRTQLLPGAINTRDTSATTTWKVRYSANPKNHSYANVSLIVGGFFPSGRGFLLEDEEGHEIHIDPAPPALRVRVDASDRVFIPAGPDGRNIADYVFTATVTNTSAAPMPLKHATLTYAFEHKGFTAGSGFDGTTPSKLALDTVLAQGDSLRLKWIMRIAYLASFESVRFRLSLYDTSGQMIFDRFKDVGIDKEQRLNLAITKTNVNWPRISFDLMWSRNGDPVWADPHQFSVTENGKPITDFSLWCPDYRVPTSLRCPLSVGLLFDCSASIDSATLVEEKNSSRAFIDMMDGVTDQASILTLRSHPERALEMTEIKPELNTTIDSLTCGGRSAVWDGILATLQEVVANGMNQCRGIIVMTDGRDNASRHLPDEIVAYARQYSLPVFSIGVGINADTLMLEKLARDTGGKYYLHPSPGDLASIYQEISYIVFGVAECSLMYDSECADGSTRNVEITLRVHAPEDTVVAKTSFISPRDTTTFMPVMISLNSRKALADSSASLYLTLKTRIQHDSLRAAVFSVLYDSSLLAFDGIITQGYLLDSSLVSAQSVPGGITIMTKSKYFTDAYGILAAIRFRTKHVKDTVRCPVRLADWSFVRGCQYPALSDGEIIIYETGAVATDGVAQPAGYMLDQNHPNPFSAKTTIRYQLPEAGLARLTVFDMLGRTVRTLVNDRIPAGTREAIFDASGLVPGMYFYLLETKSGVMTKTMMVLN